MRLRYVLLLLVLTSWAGVAHAQTPGIQLFTLVGLADDVCADPTDINSCTPTATSVTALPGQQVVVRYTVENTGDVPLTLHDLVDSGAGVILASFSYTLTPGASVYLDNFAFAPTTPGLTTNTATWTARDGGIVVSDSDTYQINVLTPNPAIDLTTLVGVADDVCADPTDINSCTPTATSVTALPGQQVVVRYTVENTGTVPLTLHDLVDSGVGVILASFSYTLTPGALVYLDQFITAPTTPGPTLFSATWTARDGGYVATDTDTYQINVGTGCLDPSEDPSYAGGYVLNLAQDRAFVWVEAPRGAEQVRFYNTSNLVVGDPETDTESGTAVPYDSRTGDTFDFSAGPMTLYFPIMTNGGGTKVSFFLEITDECGSVDVDPTFAITGLSSEDLSGFALAPAAPSPTAASATIRFSLEQSARVRLAVYDVLGREVARLVDGTLSEGAHEAAFDASALPSGLYVYRLEAGGQALQKTLTVVR